MTNTIVTDTPDTSSDEFVEGVMYTLEPGDRFYTDPVNQLTRPASDLNPERVEVFRNALDSDDFKLAWFGRVYNIDGTELDRHTADWDRLWDAMTIAYIDEPTRRPYDEFTFSPNILVRVGSTVFVSRGSFYLYSSKADEDGIEHFTFSSPAGILELENQKSRDFLATEAGAALISQAPDWASLDETELNFELQPEGMVAVQFQSEGEQAYLFQSGEYNTTTRTLTLADDGPIIIFGELTFKTIDEFAEHATVAIGALTRIRGIVTKETI